MLELKIPIRPYDDEFKFPRKPLIIETGLTVLVGCNGAGKSTLLRLIKDGLKDRKDCIVIEHNDRTGGQGMMIDGLMMRGFTTDAANMMCSSEGERIHQSVGLKFSQLGNKIRSQHPKEVFILFDAVSSGLSIDNAIEIKDFVNFVQKEESNIDFYFIVTTNEFEFAYQSDCIDVTTFNHRTFKSYNSYKRFVLNSRKKKDKRYGGE